MKNQRGTLYRTDGQAILVKPINGKQFSLAELQDAVGGYIEMVRSLDKRTNLYVNEEGGEFLKNLPPNGHTEAIVDMKAYEYGPNENFVIRGNAIATYRVNRDEENDLGRMLISEAKEI